MNYYADLDPYLIRERNEGLLTEAQTLRLERRLRGERGEPSGSRLVSLARTATLPLLRRAGLAGC
jgi:hypothetical protein